MKILLDTHIFLWLIIGDERLHTNLRNTIRNPENLVYLSVVSIWETIVKHKLGKLPLPEPPETYLSAQRERHFITSISLDEQSIVQIVNLPLLHRDPFDRMLICQALQHELTIATVDSAIRAYSVSVI